MKKFLLLSAFILVMSACEMPAEENPDLAGGTVPAEMEDLPDVMLSADGTSVDVVTGSSCYGTTCIDKIAPWELVGEVGETYVSVDARTFTMESDTEIDSAVFDVMSSNGEGLSCEVESERVDSKNYTVTLCDDLEGETLLHMGLNFENGSVEYYAALSL